MRLYIILFFVSVLTFSCRNDLSRDADYVRALNFFDSKLVSQFPKEGGYKLFSLEIDTIARYNTVSITATLDLTKEQFDKIYVQYKNNHFIKNNDQRIIVVNSFLNNHNFPEPMTVFCGEACINKTILKTPFYILPNFYFNDNQDSTTITKLSPLFEHIILEQKQGIYSQKINPQISSMPLSFFHGYAKGLSLNRTESKVIYWTIIW